MTRSIQICNKILYIPSPLYENFDLPPTPSLFSRSRQSSAKPPNTTQLSNISTMVSPVIIAAERAANEANESPESAASAVVPAPNPDADNVAAAVVPAAKSTSDSRPPSKKAKHHRHGIKNKSIKKTTVSKFRPKTREEREAIKKKKGVAPSILGYLNLPPGVRRRMSHNVYFRHRFGC